jgi:nucleotide-binding universal stress UspA family protein
MFKNILIPISSESYQKEVLQRGAFLAKKFKSTLNLLYIIEEKTLNQTDKRTDAYRTHYDIEKTKQEIIREYTQTADDIVFEDAKLFFQKQNIVFKEKIAKGEFSKIIKAEMRINNYDLILMGFEKECLLNYRLLDDVDIPVWTVSNIEGSTILAVCSNLAPNLKVPEISAKLTKEFGWNLHMIYVVDIQDSVEVDKTGKRSDKKSVDDLLNKGKLFITDMKKKGIDTTLLTGSLESEISKAAEKYNANLVIIGREQKKKSTLGLPAKAVKRKIVEKCKYSILFVN